MKELDPKRRETKRNTQSPCQLKSGIVTQRIGGNLSMLWETYKEHYKHF
jgi:hypothetical protein